MPSFSERLRLAIAGETDPDEVRKRTEEAIAEYVVRTSQQRFNQVAHQHISDQWKEDPPRKRRKRHK